DSPVRVGVFAGDVGVRMLQFYTTDRTAVRRAIAQITPTGMIEEKKAERADDLLNQRREIDAANASAITGALAAGRAALARSAAEIGERETERALIQTELNMMRTYENFDRAHKGYDTSGVLMSVVQSLAMYPGRKTIVFFSEGLPVTPSLTAKLDTLID